MRNRVIKSDRTLTLDSPLLYFLSTAIGALDRTETTPLGCICVRLYRGVACTNLDRYMVGLEPLLKLVDLLHVRVVVVRKGSVERLERGRLFSQELHESFLLCLRLLVVKIELFQHFLMFLTQLDLTIDTVDLFRERELITIVTHGHHIENDFLFFRFLIIFPRSLEKIMTIFRAIIIFDMNLDQIQGLFDHPIGLVRRNILRNSFEEEDVPVQLTVALVVEAVRRCIVVRVGHPPEEEDEDVHDQCCHDREDVRDHQHCRVRRQVKDRELQQVDVVLVRLGGLAEVLFLSTSFAIISRFGVQ